MITLFIIVCIVAVSIVCFYNKQYFHYLEFNPYLVSNAKGHFHRFFTHAFVHADWMHLFFNVFVLYNFGRVVELYYAQWFGNKAVLYFLMLYLGGILFSALPAIKKHKHNPHYNAVGASGAVSAVLFASILFSPTSKIYIFFIPFGIPAYLFGLLYLLLEYYLDKNSNDMIAHDAHYYGAIFGLLFTIALDYQILFAFIHQVFPF